MKVWCEDIYEIKIRSGASGQPTSLLWLPVSKLSRSSQWPLRPHASQQTTTALLNGDGKPGKLNCLLQFGRGTGERWAQKTRSFIFITNAPPCVFRKPFLCLIFNQRGETSSSETWGLNFEQKKHAIDPFKSFRFPYHGPLDIRRNNRS